VGQFRNHSEDRIFLFLFIELTRTILGKRRLGLLEIRNLKCIAKEKKKETKTPFFIMCEAGLNTDIVLLAFLH